ncbi:MAG: hypothetical protein HY400_00100 [Elusimicrobia bacterium]|nr:hypothetical protein [Elusimicrobiota bacterium]
MKSFILFLVFATLPAWPEQKLENRLLTEISKGSYFRATELYKEYTIRENPSPLAQHIAGYAWLKLNVLEVAKDLLQKASGQETSQTPGIPPVQQLLSKIESIELILPPLLPIKDLPRIQVRASGEAGWEKTILTDIATFSVVAWRVLRQDPAPIQIVLLPDKNSFENLHRLLLDAEPRPPWKTATGNLHIVLLSPVSSSTALHEYGHAILHTFFGDHYGEMIPPWFDEGIAGLMASELDPTLLEQAKRTLKSLHSKEDITALDDISPSLFYDSGPELNYAISTLMAEELRRRKGQEIFRKILLQTKKSRSLREGLQRAAGLSPESLYSTTLQRHSPQ